jgi:DNA-3-methyladenine glycosylase II
VLLFLASLFKDLSNHDIILHIRKGRFKMIEIYNKKHPFVQDLIQKDQRLAKIIDQIEEIKVPISEDYFNSLVEIIVAQQLSAKVAVVLNERLKTLLNQKIDPYEILSLDDDTLRLIGLSKQKITYLRHLSTYYIENKTIFNQLEQYQDEEVITHLTKVKGIGRWTSEMFLIFSLKRYDVFSVLDLGLREAVKKLYDLPLLTHDEIIQIASSWAPYRTIASHYLWHIWDNGVKT